MFILASMYQAKDISITFLGGNDAGASGPTSSTGANRMLQLVNYRISGSSSQQIDLTEAKASFRRSLMDAHLTGIDAAGTSMNVDSHSTGNMAESDSDSTVEAVGSSKHSNSDSMDSDMTDSAVAHSPVITEKVVKRKKFTKTTKIETQDIDDSDDMPAVVHTVKVVKKNSDNIKLPHIHGSLNRDVSDDSDDQVIF